MEKILNGKKIAVLVENEYIPEELEAYKQRFTELGATVHFMSRLWGKPSIDFISDVDAPGKLPETIQVTTDFQKADINEYSAVLVAANYVSVRLRYFQAPDSMKIAPWMTATSPAVQFFATAMKNPRIVKGALCHALWLLTPLPELLRGRRVICHEVMLADVHNAGAVYVPADSGVVVDGDLVTGRSKDEVYLYIDEIAQQIKRIEDGEPSVPYAEQALAARGGKLKVHIVLSSFGYWGEELVAPMEEFDKVGITYDFSTPYGYPARVVDVSMDPDYIDPPLNRKVTTPEMAAKVKKLVDSDVLKTVKKVSDVHVDDFDALLLVGGSGPILDMNNCRALHDLIRACVNTNKTVAAECYAVGALAYTRKPEDPNVRSVIYGKQVTGHPIPHDYTTEYGYSGVKSDSSFIGPAVPLEYMLRDAVGPNGQFFGNLDKEISVVVDPPFITSRSVAESRECGRQVVGQLIPSAFFAKRK